MGTTRSANTADAIAMLGATPAVNDVFDAAALARAVGDAAPEVVIHQLTELTSASGTPGYEAGLACNERLRIEGTRNLVAAARVAGVPRMIAQSIAFVYAPGEGPRTEDDPLMAGNVTADAVAVLEQETLSLPEGIVLRYGFFYGPGTWSGDEPAHSPAIHVDAAVQATRLALTGSGAASTTLPKTIRVSRALR